jgi:hypothetical protein
MSVVSCDPIKDGRGGEWSYDQSRKWTRKFRIVTDDDRDGPATVVLCPSLPQPGDLYSTGTESDSLAFLKSLVPEQDDKDARLWTVTATYETLAQASGGGSNTPGNGGASPTARPENPLDRPTEWRASSVKVKKAVTTDKDGKDVKNSAGLFYNPGYERDVAIAQITATKNYASLPFKTALDYVEKCNSDVWHGFPAKTVKVDGVDEQSMFENNYPYVRVTWTFLYDPDGWNPTRILDRGPYYLNAGAIKFDVDAATGAVVPDVLLDGTGAKLVAPAVAVYNLFRFHDETSFASLP